MGFFNAYPGARPLAKEHTGSKSTDTHWESYAVRAAPQTVILFYKKLHGDLKWEGDVMVGPNGLRLKVNSASGEFPSGSRGKGLEEDDEVTIVGPGAGEATVIVVSQTVKKA